MSSKYLFLVFIINSIKLVLTKDLLSPCKVDDSACITKSVKAAIPKILAGIPELGVKSSDPLFMPKIEADVPGINYKFFNSTVTGFKDCIISNLIVNSYLTTLHYKLDCEQLKMSGTYEIRGTMLDLYVEGKGPYELVTGKYNFIVDSELKQSTANDGKTYLFVSVENFKLTNTALTGNRYDFKNLFDGQKDLSDTAHDFAHENWETVQNLLGDPTWYACFKAILSNVNTYLENVPLEDFKLN